MGPATRRVPSVAFSISYYLVCSFAYGVATWAVMTKSYESALDRDYFPSLTGLCIAMAGTGYSAFAVLVGARHGVPGKGECQSAPSSTIGENATDIVVDLSLQTKY